MSDKSASSELDPTPWVEQACVWEYLERFNDPRWCTSPAFLPREGYEQDQSLYPEHVTKEYS